MEVNTCSSSSNQQIALSPNIAATNEQCGEETPIWKLPDVLLVWTFLFFIFLNWEFFILK
jgi:hypothetical protein